MKQYDTNSHATAQAIDLMCTTSLRQGYYCKYFLSIKYAHYSFICIIRIIMKIIYNEDLGRNGSHTQFQED